MLVMIFPPKSKVRRRPPYKSAALCPNCSKSSSDPVAGVADPEQPVEPQLEDPRQHGEHAATAHASNGRFTVRRAVAFEQYQHPSRRGAKLARADCTSRGARSSGSAGGQCSRQRAEQ